MKTDATKTNPRDRILEVASELFFQQGYRATGINEVIAKSGVAKATFYNHFATKDDLCLAYLQDRNTTEFATISEFIAGLQDPRERFLAVMEAVAPWLEANNLRGCAFLNIIAEVPDPQSRLRQEGARHYDKLRRLIRDLAENLIASDGKRYGHLDAGILADDYLVILGGAIAMAEIYQDLWPVFQGVDMVRRMID